MKNKLGIVVALIFVFSFGSLVYARSSNNSPNRGITTITRINKGKKRHHRRWWYRRNRTRMRRNRMMRNDNRR